MKKALRRGLATVLALSMVLSMTLTSSFAATESGSGDAYIPVTVEEEGLADNNVYYDLEDVYDGYEPGVTVVEDEDSPTGYNAIFVFDESSVDPTEYGLVDVAKVQVYSDGMYLFSYDEQVADEALDPQYAHTPHEFEVGMYPAGGDTNKAEGKIAYYEDMVEFADGMWGATIPLTSGATYYNYRLTDSEGTADTKYIDDPANPAMVNEASGVSSRSSMVYVPYHENMGNGDWADRTVENPREDGKTGEVEFVAYGEDGSERYLGIYLPYGYDADRAEPYNVLYMSHGWQSEQLGSELRWLNECAVPNIMDNLEGDFIVVTMNNQDFWFSYSKAWPELQNIIAYMEENYNVGTEAANRALAGLSYGGYLTSQIYVNNPDQFDYFGIWSYAANKTLTNLDDESKAALAAEDVNLSIGSGDWDYMLPETDAFAAQLDELGIEYDVMSVPGSHDWRTWQAMFAEGVENFFFQEEVDYSAYEPGVTVEAEENSPTGFTATFIYEEQDMAYYADLAAMEGYSSGKGSLGDSTEITKVELYSDCMMLFNYDEQEAGTSISGDNAHEPGEYEVGMYPAGGNGSTTYTVEMTEFASGLWGVQVPLTSGATVYNFTVYGDADGAKQSRLDDPNNPTMWNDATDIHSLSSMVYVPYDEDKMGDGEWADRTVENPREDGKTGTVETVGYTGAVGDLRGLAVYLPYGYDADRAEPYNVLYLSHGASGDPTGNDMRWMNEGAVANIMDNLDGDFVVVTMNNQDLGWNQDKIWAEQELIMAYMEENYNVADTAEGRAFAGLSMGGNTTSTIYMNHSDQFAYFGIWSYANTSLQGQLTEEQWDVLEAANSHIFMAAGDWDYLLGPVDTFAAGLADHGIEYDYLTVPAAHDWECWQMIYAYAVENFFFKSIDYSAYEPGVTVEADENSPTGYTATFIYEEQESYEGLGEIAKVELYSDCFWLFDPEGDLPLGKTPSREDGVPPEEYEAGLYPAGGSGGTNGYYAEMTKLGNGLWGLKVPLSSGAFVYNFQVTDVAGTLKSRLDDPNNPKLWNEATGIGSLSSMVYVPYDEAKMGDGQWADRSVELPVADEADKGTVKTVAYTGAAGDTRGLAVYLPADYDASREEPYNVLYLSHGASGDKVGNELRWMSEGAVPNIMDNLVAEGKIDSFVVVTMNNQDLGWSYDKVWAEQELIMAYMEENYNVADTAEGRAFAGLSMGGLTTSNMYLNHAEEFSYYGIWSYANAGGVAAKAEYLKGLEKQPQLMLAAGMWDYLRSPVITFGENVAELGIHSTYYEVPGAHDWETWQLIYAYAAENFFFQTGEYANYEPGVTVEADENSPTGFTATFIYEEQESYGNLGDITKVELYSDTFWLFDPEGDAPVGVTPTREDGFAPEQYVPGLVPAGGSGDSNGYYGEMYEFAPGMWGIQVPLTSGAFPYNFQVYDADGNMKSRLDDPNNPKMYNEATGIGSLSSMVYVPYSADTMGTGKWADRSVELPIADESKKGTVETVAYTGANGDTRGLAVYLPDGYNANRAEPYKVLYLSHGMSSDANGNELRWMNEGAVPNIMDNLVAEGKAEPFVIVTMNNQNIDPNGRWWNWNYDQIWAEQELIMDYIEANYNVADTAEGRAYAGLSMGGMTTSNMYLNHAEDFSHFGIWSYANDSAVADKAEYLKGQDKQPEIMLAAGQWDYLRVPVMNFGVELDKLGIESSYYEVPAAHDWKCWQLIFAYAAENFFWQSEESGSTGGSGGSSGSISQPAEIVESEHGSVMVNPVKGSVGSTVTITAAPDAGYEVGSVTVTDADGKEITVKAIGNNKYTYVQPGRSKQPVTVEVTFVKADQATGLPFVDVDAEDWFYDKVKYAYEEGLMAGTSSNTFSPDVTTTRGMIVTILYSLEGKPAVSGDAGFEDVAAGAYYAKAVTWAAANGIVAGYGDGNFGPNDNITREQMAAILYKYAIYKDYDVSAGENTNLLGYDDAQEISKYAVPAIQWAVADGLMSGTTESTLDPAGSATRAQVATMLMRFCENVK